MTDELIELIAESYDISLRLHWHTPELAAKAALQAIQSSGTFMVVPVEPNEAMLEVGRVKHNQVLGGPSSVYSAMLDACK